LSNNAGDVDTGEVAHAAAVIRGSLEAGELLLSDLSFADGVVVIRITAGEDVDVGVVVAILIAYAETFESGTEDSGGEEEGGEDGSSWEKHFGLRLVNWLE